MVRDLWALRLQIIKHQDKDAPEESDLESQQLFSSQGEISEEYDGSAREMKKREKNLPTLIDTLGLCYLGMMLLRIPVSLGDIHKYLLEGCHLERTLIHIKMGHSRRSSLHTASAPYPTTDEVKASNSLYPGTQYASTFDSS